MFWLLMMLTEVAFLALLFGDSENLPDTQASAQIMEFTPFIFIMVFFDLCNLYTHYRRNHI